MKAANNSAISRETWLSLLILLILGCIAVSVFTAQFSFNPAVIQSTGAALSSPQPEQIMTTAAVDTLLELPPGIRPLTPPEAFSPGRMSDKINGKAELYLSAGCRGLQSQRFADSAAEGRWMEIFIFDMDSHENAFAVYSSQRRDDAEPIGLTPNAYRTQNALYFVHGGTYVEFIASEASAAALDTMETMAKSFIDATGVQTAAVSEPELFPTTGLDPDSIRMIAADAFGFDELDRVFAAAYSFQGNELTAFLSNRPSNAAAVELAAAYRDFLITFGGVDVTERSDPDIPDAVVIEILGTSEIIFTRGNYLAGVHEAADLKSAISVSRQLFHRLGGDRIAK